MASKFEELKKLPPEERIKRLKELQEQDKKEIEEAAELMKKSQNEADANAEELRRVPIPQFKAVDLDSLFTEDEKDAVSVSRYLDAELRKKRAHRLDELTKEDKAPQSLDKQIEHEQVAQTEKVREEMQRQYFTQKSNTEVINRFYQIGQRIEEKGYVNPEERAEMRALYEDVARREFEEHEKDKQMYESLDAVRKQLKDRLSYHR